MALVVGTLAIRVVEVWVFGNDSVVDACVISRDSESKPRRLFDIFEIRFRKTTEGAKDKNNNSLYSLCSLWFYF